MKSVQKSVRHARKYDLSKIKLEICTHFFGSLVEILHIFALVLNFHSGTIKNSCKKVLLLFFSRFQDFWDAPPPMGQWGARRSTGGYNTWHDMFAPML